MHSSGPARAPQSAWPARACELRAGYRLLSAEDNTTGGATIHSVRQRPASTERPFAGDTKGRTVYTPAATEDLWQAATIVPAGTYAQLAEQDHDNRSRRPLGVRPSGPRGGTLTGLRGR